ncbi:aspartate carbamoyltransferase catalytic subunit [Candidatus Cyanaurora vandensis]|uniref:aspartate carbamoyltransferase catalytic subunit n=1 Tax=Candidatus Cyanaurora vandensis TaxID=2714958 RepID=UPI00257E986D|nr:aspartate carbamoyltransferase catalytic subunit [Candidatus Cyanaurora vandensis]
MSALVWQRRHILGLRDFTPPEYELVLRTTHTFQGVLARQNRKVPTLQGKTVVNLFFESSTRTRSSFEMAAKGLSADVLNFSPSTSSLTKGETILDTARTYCAMGVAILIVRHREPGVPHLIARDVDAWGVRVFNAGDGQHEHPTQGLLDLYTLCHSLDPDQPRPQLLRGKKVVIVGDVLHSRVARSNLWALQHCGAEVHLAGPPTLVPKLFRELGATVHHQLAPALEGAHFVMALRIQQERIDQQLIPTLREYHQLYGLNHERLKACAPGVKLLHPGPTNRDVEITSELMDDPQLSLIDRQVTTGLASRMALLYLLGGGKP